MMVMIGASIGCWKRETVVTVAAVRIRPRITSHEWHLFTAVQSTGRGVATGIAGIAVMVMIMVSGAVAVRARTVVMSVCMTRSSFLGAPVDGAAILHISIAVGHLSPPTSTSLASTYR